MKLLADLHTHSKNSRFGHGKNTIEEMVIEANEIGLVEIGITDHGYAHFFRTSKKKLKEARKIVDEINEWSKTKVLLGVEADIISEDGTLDIDNETLAMLDILVVGYHRMIFTDFAGFWGNTKKTAEARQKCTNAFVNAINKYPVTIVSHLDSVLKTDLYEIGKVCKERGTLVEINNRHTKWTEKQMNDLIDSGCLFVLSSDAHQRKSVGDVDRAMEYIKKYNIPSERIANIEFSEEEKSELDRAYTVYKSVYDQLESTKKKKQEEFERKQRTEITGKLSEETEKKLMAIAKEQGLRYEPLNQGVEDNQTINNLFDEDLFGQSRDYIKENKFNSFRKEHDSIIEDKEQEIKYSFDDSHPLIKDEFADKFQAINSVIRQSEETKENNVVNVNEYKSNVQANNNLSAFEQLNSSSLNQSDMQNLKNIMAGSNSTDRMTIENNNDSVKTNLDTGINDNLKVNTAPRKVTPENFMESITQTKLSNATEQSKPLEQDEVNKQVVKPVKKNNKRGAFIAVDNLIDGEKK